MKLQPIEHQHLKECAGLFVSVFNSPPWNEKWALESALDRLKDFLNTPEAYGIVATLESRIVGFAVGNVEKWYQGKNFYLREICVQSTKQRNGIGTKIIDTLYHNLVSEDIDKIYLLTLRESPAEAFYEKCGFSSNPRIIMMSKTCEGTMVS